MQRRTFLHLTGLGALGAIAGCAEATTQPPPAPPSDASTPMGDALVQVPDSGNAATDAGSAMFVVSGFSILLNDSSCSGHDHGCDVTPAVYADDSPVSFLGGSHLVQFRPSELVRLQNGEQLAFATNGPGPGHGHCGLAWRADALYEISRTRVDACDVIPPATGQPAICTMHPRT